MPEEELEHSPFDHHEDIAAVSAEVAYGRLVGARIRFKAVPGLDAAWLRQLCLDCGADDAGLVEISRPALDDQRADILRAFPPTKTLLGFVCRMNREPIRSPARSVANLEFHHTGDHTNEVARKVVVEGTETSEAISPDKITEYLGVPRYRPTVAEEQNEIGIATGLAWTEVGGEILITEATLMPGRGRLTLTGKLGDVMQESAQAAMSFVRSRAEEFGIPKDFNRKLDVHVHIPEGAIPKDGPSAGITLATALVSALARVPTRTDVAMTGEITLRGKVLPIGGVKEKVLAAHRAGIKNIIVPKDNEKDLADIPKNVLDSLNMYLVSTMDEVLKIAVAGPMPAALPAEVEWRNRLSPGLDVVVAFYTSRTALAREWSRLTAAVAPNGTVSPVSTVNE